MALPEGLLSMQGFRRLKVREKSHQLVLMIYRITEAFPRDERFGRTSQIRRSAGSIPTNIAEGCGRGSDPDFARFLQMAIGSACELEYQALLARDLGFLDDPAYEVIDSEVGQVRSMLITLLRTVRQGNKL